MSPKPLTEFPQWKQDEIAALVARPKPPPRWLDFGLAQIPSRAWYEWYWQRDINPDKRSSGFSTGLRDLIITRDGYRCGLCGLAVPEDDVHLDHILPRSLGGSDAPSNLQVAHSLCNMRKGNRV